MTSARENLLKVYRHEEPDWVPVVVLGDGYNRPIGMPAAFYDDERHMSTSRALSNYFCLDVLERISPLEEVYTGVEYRRVEADGLERQYWETPYGTLTAARQRVEYSAGAGVPNLVTWFPVEYPLKSKADYRAFVYMFEHLEYRLDRRAIAQTREEVGDTGIVTVSAPSSPLGMCVRLYAGIEHLAFAWSDSTRELRDLLGVIGEKNLEAYRLIAASEADATINYDDTTTYAISPTMFRELEVPFLCRSADVLHQGNKLCIHHACGHVSRLLEEFRATHIDGFDGPALPPVGDTSVGRARQGLGDGIVIMPFVEQTVLEGGDPLAIRDCVREMLRANGSRRNLVLDIVSPPAAPVANLWLAVDEAKRQVHCN
jgi:hypothetical protein